MSLASAPISERKKQSDVLVWLADERFCCDAVTLTNNSGADVDFQPCQILDYVTDHYEPTNASDNEGFAILLEDVGTLADGESATCKVLVRGPAIVNESALTVAAGTLATIITDLKTNLGDTKFITEPTKVQEGNLQ